MTDDPSSSTSSSRGQEKSWLEKLLAGFHSEPQSREDLLDIIQDAAENQLLDQEAVGFIRGALDVQDQQVRSVMVPRSKMTVININDDLMTLLGTVVDSAHSRFPVIGDSIDDIKGILLAKDLLPLIGQISEPFSLEKLIRPASIIPESKRLNVLLREFREKRYHMALVIDEYGSISGLVTIEDILEEIVGEIEDETDENDEVPLIRKVSDSEYIVRGLTPIDDFNHELGSQISDSEFDTIGGILTQSFGRVPERNEVTELEHMQFRVLNADKRRIDLIRVTLQEALPSTE